MKKIGILGGTFNPIHNGHLALAQAAYEFCCLDKVWFMPSGVSCLKERDNVVSDIHRLEMTKLAVQGISYFDYSDMELGQIGYTYTADTLKRLHEKYPENEFYFIMGADTFLRFPRWKDTEKIASLCTLVTVVRDDVDMQEISKQQVYVEETLHANVIIVPFRKVDVSSSIIRNKLSKGESVMGMIPENVLEYIEIQGLYKENQSGRD